MIIETFDIGWGPDVPLKQFENRLMAQYLKPFVEDSVPTVVIQSVWYSTDYHKQVLQRLRTLKFNRIVLLAMLDAPIIRRGMYTEFDCDIYEVGYYPGDYEIDFWALTVDEYFTVDPNALPPDITTAYMCLNRKPHWHRRRLYDDLSNRGLLDLGLVSLGGNDSPATRTLAIDQGESPFAPNAGKHQNGISNDIMSLGHPDNWRSIFLNVVTETVFDIEKNNFVSEKIYKPIIGERPFLVYAPDGASNWLRCHGFLDYTKDFKDISDLDLTQDRSIPDFLVMLCNQTPSYWQKKYIDLREKILYNKLQFKKYVNDIKIKINQGIVCRT